VPIEIAKSMRIMSGINPTAAKQNQRASFVAPAKTNPRNNINERNSLIVITKI